MIQFEEKMIKIQSSYTKTDNTCNCILHRKMGNNSICVLLLVKLNMAFAAIDDKKCEMGEKVLGPKKNLEAN